MVRQRLVTCLAQCVEWKGFTAVAKHANKIIAAIVVALAALSMSGCASCSRSYKSMQSDFGGGLHRRVTLYDYSGNVIDQWEGTFDVAENDQEVYFDVGGKRVIIQGGIVVNEEL